MIRISVTLMVVFAALSGAAQQSDPIAVLGSDADYKTKSEACRTLARSGGAEAVPALEALLNDAEMAHMARYALESIPAPEAGAALRRALPIVDDARKVGIMSTLTARHEKEAISVIVPLLRSDSPQVRREAARSLSRLIALDADLDMVAVEENPEVLVALSPHLVNFAERLLEAGRGAAALPIYDTVRRAPEVSAPVRDAALRGAILAHGPSDVSLLVESLHADNVGQFDAAIRAARELGGSGAVAEALGKELPNLPDWAKVSVLQVVGARGEDAAGPAAVSLAKEGTTEVRVAAIQALARMSYSPAVSMLASLTGDPDEAVAGAARDAFIYFPGGEGDNILLAMFDSENASERLTAIDLAARGGLDEPVAPLMKTASSDPNEDVRVAALKVLRGFAGVDELPALLSVLLSADSKDEIQSAESALKAICQREQQTTSADIEIRNAVWGDLPDGQSKDVTDKVADIVEGGANTVEASNGNFGDAAPGVRKSLRVDFVANGVTLSKSAAEGQTITLTSTYVPENIVDAFRTALDQAEGPARLAVFRLLGQTGSPKALESVVAVARGPLGEARDTAQRVLCEWPSPDALPVVLELVENADSQDLKMLALRGAMRLLNETPDGKEGYALLFKRAKDADERKLLLSGLGRIPSADALEMALVQAADPAVRDEALVAAINIAKTLGEDAREADEPAGPDAWEGNMQYWRVEDGAVVGSSEVDIPRNEFLWTGFTVSDFYLDLDVKLEPNSANAGIQFRSSKVDDQGQAKGYQADVGEGYWGRLYHEHGRGMLDGTATAEAAVKPGEWNRYEILAIGPVIWTAINGTLGVAYVDDPELAERTGEIALQIHSGAPQTVRYHPRALVHDPEIKLSGQDAATLIRALFD